jgi:hypothetical protein
VHPDRPFKGTHLFVSTPENIDIVGLQAGHKEYLCHGGSPLDAVAFRQPAGDLRLPSESELVALERCRVDMDAVGAGTQIVLIVKFRDLFVARAEFLARPQSGRLEFRAVLVGQEVV